MAESRYIALFSSRVGDDLNLARTLSPTVEIHFSGCLILTVPETYEEATLTRITDSHIGLGRIFFAVASTRTAAFFVARHSPGTRIPINQQARYLRACPVELLQLWDREISSDTLETLSRWGIRTFGQLSDLPCQQLASRLGRLGESLQRLARGEDIKLLPRCPEPIRFEETCELEWELDDLEPLSFILGDLMERLCRTLGGQGLASDQITIILKLVSGVYFERAVPLAFPMSNWRVLLSLLRLKLQTDPPGEAIVRVQLKVRPAQPQVMQYSLLESASANPEKISRTLARLTTLVGPEHTGIPHLPDTYRPDAFQVREFPLRFKATEQSQAVAVKANGNGSRPRLTLKRLRPPVEIRISTEQIVACSGPWKSSGNWWQGEPQKKDDESYWRREEWDVELINGKICRVFWDALEKQWLLEGFYD